ncbi:MAG: hypothetical protein KAU28_10780, partial [Phycisphaerae bacterium]|nr:hypothetical protein [Phycisphaerae bacterium]
MKHFTVCHLAAAAVVMLCPYLAAGQQDAVSLQRGLDRPVSLTVTDTPISEIFKQLEDASGVKFVIDDDTLACLPYGDQTRLTVRLKNVTLRGALTPILAPQALRWDIEGEAVRIVPTEALYRMCRRATFDELQILGQIHTHSLRVAAEAGSVVEQLRKRLPKRNLRLLFHVEADKEKAFARAARALPGTAAQYFDMLCHGQGWTWYLWGEDIVIIDKKAQVARQLKKQISLRYRGAQLVEVLSDLAHEARVTMTMAPGVLKRLSAETRNNFNLVMAEASIAEALQVISGATGLEFTTTETGIHVEASKALKSDGRRGERRRVP